MLKAAFIHIVLLPVFISASGLDNNNTTTAATIDVCFYVEGDASPVRKTFANSTGVRKFITERHVKVEIHDQPLTKVHKYSFTGMRHVQELIIWDCGVIDVEAGAFQGSLSLRKLDLRGNYLERISTGIFNHLNVIDLNLSYNKVKTIETEAFNPMIFLKKIDLSNNLISNYSPSWFGRKHFLRELHFENNSIGSLPENAFSNVIDIEFAQTDIFFSSNTISSIHPETFKGLKGMLIRKFHIDHNSLTIWKENWTINIDELNISHNSIKTIKGDLAKIIKNHSLKNFEHNPYNCSCLKEIKSIGDNYREHSQWFVDRYAECRMPKRRRKLPNKTTVRNMQIWSSF
ncbi:asporin-like isoform X1 [Rhynchophorus ferrugineus]|uniref:asporin-like isoform X1 n=1 Tax=Rhynchophorus ferrugineus TaxID=354439 RepID=UPI003FCE7032